MPELSTQAPSATRRLVVDLALAACVAVPGLAGLPWSSPGDSTGNVVPTVVLLLIAGTSVLARGRRPIVGAVAGSFAVVVAFQTGSFDPAGSSIDGGLVTYGLLLWVVVLAYTLGNLRSLATSLVGLVPLLIAPQWGGGRPDPFPAVLAIGPWLVGRLVRSHRELAATLESRARELAAERQRYTAEAVRYERARIARELHDVVAHCMSIVVVQAVAGQRLDHPDPAVVDRLLDDIHDLAQQAESDLTALTRLLCQQIPATAGLSREAIDQLVTHATSAGTAVDVTVDGDLGTIPAPTAAALNRVLQEGLTNAIKHSPGAAVAIDVTAGSGSTIVNIRNDPAPPTPEPLLVQRGGNGLRGLDSRVSALGGTVRGAPTAAGGWLLSAEIPAVPAAVGDADAPRAARIQPNRT